MDVGLVVFLGVLVDEPRAGISGRGAIVGFNIDRGAGTLVIDCKKKSQNTLFHV